MQPGPSDLFLLASAVAGRRTAVRVASEDEGLLHAYGDGQAVVLPPAAARSEHGWMHVVSQSLLIAAGSLEPAVLRRLMARPASARRYAWLEAVRAAAVLRDRVPPLYAQRLGRTAAPCLSDSACGSATLALADPAPGEIPDFVGTVRPLAVLRGAMNPGGIGALLGRASPGGQPAHDAVPTLGEDEASEDGSVLRLFSNPFGGRNAVSEMLGRILGVGASRSHRQRANDDSDGAELPIGRIERAWRRGANAVRAHGPIEGHEPLPMNEPAAHRYPEWDSRSQRYRHDWVRVDEVDPWRPDGARTLHAALHAPSPLLRRELARLPLDMEMHRRQREGAEFDIGRLVDHAADLRTGNAAEAPDVYRASRRTRRDLGVVVVVDASGSTEERNERGESVFEHQSATAFRLARTFDSLGDRVALYGFRSWGRQRVHMVRLKGHEEAWGGCVAERLSLLDAAGFTRTGAAIRHADRLLHTRVRLPHRLLLLITDGLSYDSDYEGRHAEDDTRQALAEARAGGTACVCLCIGGSVDAAKLASVFGEAGLLMVDDGARVDARIRDACARALAGVSRRKLARLRRLALSAIPA